MVQKRQEIFDKHRPFRICPLLTFKEYKEKYADKPLRQTEEFKKRKENEKRPKTNLGKMMEVKLGAVEGLIEGTVDLMSDSNQGNTFFI